jgi:hypothetical protein
MVHPDLQTGLVRQGAGLAGAMPGLDLRVTLGQPAADGACDHEAGDEIRGVEDAVALASRALPVVALAANLGADGFQVGDRLLEDVTQDVDVQIGLEVVVRECTDAVERGIGHHQGIERGILGEQTAVVGVDLHRRQALVHRLEQTAELLPARDLDEALGLHGQGAVEHLGRQEADVLAEADEEAAVQELLGLLQQTHGV